MKKAMIVLLMLFVFCAGIALAGQQKRVQTFDSSKLEGQSLYVDLCEATCRTMSEDVDIYLKTGWQIVGLREIIKSVMAPFGVNGTCRCIGAEYILEKGE